MILFSRIKGHIQRESTLQNRLYWTMFGVCEIIDGVIKIITLGFVSSDFGYEIAKNRLQKSINHHKKREACHIKQNK